MWKLTRHSMPRALLLHFITGVPASLLFLVLAYPAARRGYPPLLPFLICVLFVLVPTQVLIMKRAGRREHAPLFVYNRPMPISRMAIIIFACLAWAAACFVVLEPILARPLKDGLFQWWPRPLMLGDYLRNPRMYSADVRVLTWTLGLVASIIVPVCEELYFRGYLMPRLPFRGVMVPLASTVLFVLYHFWSPWLFATRVIAVFPAYYATWRTRNIRPAVVVHVLLNLVGDVILTVPVVFGGG